MKSKYTKEQKEWLFKNAYGKTASELVEKFNKKFNVNFTATQIDFFKQYYNLTGGIRATYTEEQTKWLKENISGTSLKELTKRFNEKFKTSLTINQIRAFKNNNNLKNGLKKRSLTEEQLKWLEKNVTGIYCDELTKKFNKRFGTNFSVKKMQIFKDTYGFKSGLTGKNGYFPSEKPIGSESEKKNEGYVRVKVGRGKKGWKLKHRLIYEKYHGPIPEGYCVAFANGNKKDYSKENLILVKDNVLRRASVNHLLTSDIETTKTGMLLAELMVEISEAKKGLKNKKGQEKNEL